MKRTSIELISDYTPLDSPNILKIIKDDQGDFHISIQENNEDEHGVRIAASGTRFSPRVRKAFQDLFSALENESLPEIE